MGANQRSVRHLRIRAASQAHVRSAVIRLEDALRCASLPDAATRVLMVRRLNLGVLAPDASPQSLSRLLEQRVAAAGGTWEHGASASAAAADFVYFHDVLDARIELALRLAHNALCSAWYWPLAVAEFDAARSAPANLCRMAQAIAALPEAAVALPAWIARLAAGGAAALLARAITPLQGAELLHAAHLPLPPPDVPTPRHAAAPAPAATHPSRPSWATHHTHAAVPVWLRTLALAGGHRLSDTLPAPPATPHVPAAAAAEHGTPPLRVAPRAPVQVPAPQPFSTPPASARRGGLERATAAAEVPHTGVRQVQAVATGCGGLLFMLPVLQRLGYPAWAHSVDDETSMAAVCLLLRLILQRLHAPPDDPAWQLTYRAAAAEQDSPPEHIVHAQRWLIACRRWLRRQARIGVASLVRRPALLDITATHADVCFRLGDADMRVRRAGLDIDPGWIPWYGKVVAFHYTEAHRGGPSHGG